MHRDRELRARWLALCADPARDDLADAIALAFRRELDDALAALSAATTDDRRADAVASTLRAALGLELTRERTLLRPGPYLLELQRRLAGPADDVPDADDPDPVAADPDPSDPFLPWTLGDHARDASGRERERLLDASIAAFDAIALRPIDPGNDLGPFTRIAALMDESQARRALAVIARMTGAGWGPSELDHARAYLFARLAELGRIDEAESLLHTITDRSTRAYAHGRVFGHRIAHGRECPLPTDLPADPLRAFLCGLTEALPDPPEPLVLTCLDLVHAPMEILLLWSAVGPLAAWSAALRDHCRGDVRIGARLDLAASRLDDPGAPELVRAALDELLAASDPGRWIDELLVVRPHLTHADAVAVFTAWMTRAAQSPRSWLIRDIHYTRSFTDLLHWLAGDAALATAARELAALTALLGDVPADS